MNQYNHASEEFGSSNKLKSNEKKLTYVEAIHVLNQVHKDNHNWDILWGIANIVLSDIVEENENQAKECVNKDKFAIFLCIL